MKVCKFAVLLLAVGMFSATAIAQDDCATAVAAPGSLNPCDDTTPDATWVSPVTCGGVGGGGLGGTSANNVWVSFVASATAHRVTTDPSTSGTDSSFMVWDACGGNVIGCAEDISYGTPPNYLGDTCVGGLTIGNTYYVELGAWASETCTFGFLPCPYMGSCGVYDVTIGAATGDVCGDGTISCVPGAEQCDDGNTVGGDCCSADCRLEVICGNGCTEGTEQCDDGNLVSGDGCDANCQAEGPRCGNNIVDGTDECDGTGLPLCPDGEYCATDCTCRVGVPAVSEWGLLVLVLIGLTVGTVMFGRRREATA